MANIVCTCRHASRTRRPLYSLTCWINGSKMPERNSFILTNLYVCAMFRPFCRAESFERAQTGRGQITYKPGRDVSLTHRKKKKKPSTLTHAGTQQQLFDLNPTGSKWSDSHRTNHQYFIDTAANRRHSDSRGKAVKSTGTTLMMRVCVLVKGHRSPRAKLN